jgi:hypothetical protein
MKVAWLSEVAAADASCYHGGGVFLGRDEPSSQFLQRDSGRVLI